jgi:hypothetical protein
MDDGVLLGKGLSLAWEIYNIVIYHGYGSLLSLRGVGAISLCCKLQNRPSNTFILEAAAEAQSKLSQVLQD